MKTHKLVITMLLLVSMPHVVNAAAGPEEAAHALNRELRNAVIFGEEARVENLVEQGANINYELGATSVLSEAINHDHTNIALFLIGRDANIHPHDLADAINRRNTVIAKALIAHGANVNSIDTKGDFSALMAASFEKLPEIVQILLRYGADVNYTNWRGDTALKLAVLGFVGEPADKPIIDEQSIAIVNMLLNAPDINVNKLDGAGHTVLWYIRHVRNNPQIEQVLSDAGAVE